MQCAGVNVLHGSCGASLRHPILISLHEQSKIMSRSNEASQYSYWIRAVQQYGLPGDTTGRPADVRQTDSTCHRPAWGSAQKRKPSRPGLLPRASTRAVGPLLTSLLKSVSSAPSLEQPHLATWLGV